MCNRNNGSINMKATSWRWHIMQQRTTSALAAGIGANKQHNKRHQRWRWRRRQRIVALALAALQRWHAGIHQAWKNSRAAQTQWRQRLKRQRRRQARHRVSRMRVRQRWRKQWHQAR